jgi:hypothetical protein
MLKLLNKFYSDSLTTVHLVCMVTSPDVSRYLAAPKYLIILSLVGGNRISIPPASPGN